jgi:hypothetical protein
MDTLSSTVLLPPGARAVSCFHIGSLAPLPSYPVLIGAGHGRETGQCLEGTTGTEYYQFKHDTFISRVILNLVLLIISADT